MNTFLLPGVERRLLMEYADILSKPKEGVSAGPRLGHRVYPKWDGWIHGPENTPYEGGIFQVEIIIPNDYPFKPPQVIFVTKILHINVGQQGQLHVHAHNWYPGTTIQKVLLLAQSLMENPDLVCILDYDLVRLRKEDTAEYYKRVREATLQYAIPVPRDFESDGEV